LKEVVMEIGSVNTMHPAIAAAQPVAEEQKVENRSLIKAVKALNATELFGQNNELTFVLDRETHRPLVRIVNRETREVIRQIPAEHALRMAENLDVYS
jgi:flagellar protein FlaG